MPWLPEQAKPTEAVIARRIEALMARDLDGVVADYAEDAFLISNLAPAAICGPPALRGFWAQALEVFTPEVLNQLTFTHQVSEGDVA